MLLDDPDERLKPGMSARAEIEVTTREDAVVVPLQCVVDRPVEEAEEEEPVVFVVADDSAARRPVKTGISDATHVEIVEGLSEGDRVVTGPYRSLKRLKDGDRIRIADQDDEASEADSGQGEN